MSLWYLYVYVTPFPNGYVYCFNQSIQSVGVDLYLVLLNLYLRDPSLERKASFFLKVVFAVTSGFTFHNLGIFWVLTNWHCCRGTKVHICPGETTKFEKYFCGQTGILSRRKVVYLPWWLHCKTSSELKESFWLREDTHKVTLIPKYWKVLKTQKSYLREKIKKSLIFLCSVHHHHKIPILIQNGKLILQRTCWGLNLNLT